ncbi:hypothetical protein [Paenibacillus sp. CMAA1364]
MFPENLNAVNEDVSKRQLAEKQQQVMENSKKSISRSVTSTLIAVAVLAIVFGLFIWLMNR